MDNPCDNCILKVNCTEVCFPKTNYKRLIMNAITLNKTSLSTQVHFKQSRNYHKMLRTTNLDEANIVHRAKEALREF